MGKDSKDVLGLVGGEALQRRRQGIIREGGRARRDGSGQTGTAATALLHAGCGGQARERWRGRSSGHNTPYGKGSVESKGHLEILERHLYNNTSPLCV